MGCRCHRRGGAAWSRACRGPSGSARSLRPPFGGKRGAVGCCPAPVDRVGLAQPVEQNAVQPRPDTRRLPVAQPAPAGHPRPAAHLLGQVLPEMASRPSLHPQRGRRQQDADGPMPVRKMNTIPARQARSGTRGRPPLGLAGSGGSRGAISCHSSSETRGATMSGQQRPDRQVPF